MRRFRAFISIHSLLLLLFGISFLISPNAMLRVYGSHTDPAGELASRAFAVNNIVLAVVIWISRDNLTSRIARGLILALFIGNSINVLLSIHGQVNMVLSAAGWINVVLYFTITAGYGIILYIILRSGDEASE